MSAARLREAAALMRSRAEYAGESPWIAVINPSGQAWIDVPDENGHAWGMHGFPAAAIHVASWHPAVALAVADWLDRAAVISQWGDYVGPGPVNDTVTAALAVANAYLGGDQ